MEISDWEREYRDSYFKMKDMIHNVRGVFVAYNCNIDSIKKIEKTDILHMLNTVNTQTVKSRLQEYPREISSPEDFVARLLISMRDGKAAEVPTYDLKIHDWLTKNLGQGKSRMGGQAGIIANTLANIDVRNVIAYVPWLSKEQADYFVNKDNLFHPIIENNHLRLKHPTKAYSSNKKPKINWIIEYSKGIEFDFSGEKIIVPRDNRLIVSSRPPWIKIDMEKDIYEHLQEVYKGIDGALLSGYQMIKEVDEDGNTYDYYVDKSVKLIKKLKEVNPKIRIHVEFTSIQNRVIRNVILKKIIHEHVHSIGLDTVEVANALNVLGYEELAFAVIKKDERAIDALYEGAVILLHELKLERVQVHSLGYYICVSSKDSPVTPEDHKKSLLFAATVAASKAMSGDITTLEDCDQGLEVPIWKDGYNKFETLEKHLIERGIGTLKELQDGCVCTPKHDVIIIPTKVVKNPVATVGIGDTISAAAFVSMLSTLNAK